MHSMLLTPDKDPMGAAIIDYLAHGKASKLRVFSSMFDEDEIPVNQLFRTFQEMPSLEQKALQLCTGKILDVGAGSGCHTLALQEMGKEVTAIDISPLSVEAMNKRGVKDARLQNFFDKSLTGPFDTILLLMNGSGIIGKQENLPAFFHRLKEVLARDGQLLLDSSDLSYLFEDEDGNLARFIIANYISKHLHKPHFYQLVQLDKMIISERSTSVCNIRVSRGIHLIGYTSISTRSIYTQGKPASKPRR